MIRIVADSTIDLPTGAQAQYGIGIVPINIQFGTDSYREGVDMDQKQFYARIAAEHHLPKTSQPSPGEFTALYRQVAAQGDTIISMHVTGKLSGTCQSAQLAASQLKDEFDIRVFDSMSGSAGLGFMAMEAARMAQRNESIDAIMARLDVLRSRFTVFFTPENLKYLQMSGRVSNTAALIGSVLSLKPIIALENGLLHPVARIRTRNKAIDHVLTATKDKVGAQPVNVAVIHAEAEAEAQALMARAKQMMNVQESFIDDLAVSLAVHFGPGVLCIFTYPV
ncbi:MAG: DegV family protein [Chloroflexi bacterium]|nr:DegV family protein [Chloroflexota bacterium]